MCTCCERCQATGASKAKNEAATDISLLLRLPITGGSPNGRWADALHWVALLKKQVKSDPKALERLLRIRFPSDGSGGHAH